MVESTTLLDAYTSALAGGAGDGTLTQETIDLIDMLEASKKNIKESETIKEDIEKNIIQFIADNDGINKGDEVIATFQANKNGVRSLRIKKRI